MLAAKTISWKRSTTSRQVVQPCRRSSSGPGTTGDAASSPPLPCPSREYYRSCGRAGEETTDGRAVAHRGTGAQVEGVSLRRKVAGARASCVAAASSGGESLAVPVEPAGLGYLHDLADLGSLRRPRHRAVHL